MLAPHQGMEMTSKRIDYFDPYRVFSAHFWVFETATYCHYYQLYNGPILRVILLMNRYIGPIRDLGSGEFNEHILLH